MIKKKNTSGSITQPSDRLKNGSPPLQRPRGNTTCRMQCYKCALIFTQHKFRMKQIVNFTPPGQQLSLYKDKRGQILLDTRVNNVSSFFLVNQ